MKGGGGLGVVLRPQRDVAAIAGGIRISKKAGVGIEACLLGFQHVSRAAHIAADVDISVTVRCKISKILRIDRLKLVQHFGHLRFKKMAGAIFIRHSLLDIR
jgi:hypothetical protein